MAIPTYIEQALGHNPLGRTQTYKIRRRATFLRVSAQTLRLKTSIKVTYKQLNMRLRSGIEFTLLYQQFIINVARVNVFLNSFTAGVCHRFVLFVSDTCVS